MKEVQLQIDLDRKGRPRPLLQLLVDGQPIGNVAHISLDEKVKSQPVVTATFIVRNIITKPTLSGE